MKDFLRCIFLPLAQQMLVVPYSAVAEVVGYDNLQPVKTSVPGIIATLEWRGLRLPVLRLESLDKENSAENGKNLRIAILNRITEKGLDFLAVVLHGIPRMHRLKRSDVTFVGPSKKPYLLMEVAVREQKAQIPNLEWIEKSVADFKNPQQPTAKQ